MRQAVVMLSTEPGYWGTVVDVNSPTIQSSRSGSSISGNSSSGSNVSSREILAFACPSDYCCESAEQCSQLSACAPGHNGTLCGDCAAGFEPVYGLSGITCIACGTFVCSGGGRAAMYALLMLIVVLGTCALLALNYFKQEKGRFLSLILFCTTVLDAVMTLQRAAASTAAPSSTVHSSSTAAYTRVLQSALAFLNASLRGLNKVSLCYGSDSGTGRSSCSGDGGATTADTLKLGYVLPLMVIVFALLLIAFTVLLSFCTSRKNVSARKSLKEPLLTGKAHAELFQ
jgi:hypothetical protein